MWGVPPGFPLPCHLQGPGSPPGWRPASLPRSSNPRAPAALSPKQPVCMRGQDRSEEELGGACPQSQRPGCGAERLHSCGHEDARPRDVPRAGIRTGEASGEGGSERTGSRDPPAARKRRGDQGQGPAGLTPAPPPRMVLLQSEALPSRVLPSEAPQVGRKAHWLPGSTSRALPPLQGGGSGQGRPKPASSALSYLLASRVPAVKTTTSESCGGGGGSERTGVLGDLLSPDRHLRRRPGHRVGLSRAAVLPRPRGCELGQGRGEAHISCSHTHTHTHTHTESHRPHTAACSLKCLQSALPTPPPGQGSSQISFMKRESTWLSPSSLWSRGHTNEPHHLPLVTKQN